MEWTVAISGLVSAIAAALSALLALLARRDAKDAEQEAKRAEHLVRLWPTAAQAQRTARRTVSEFLDNSVERSRREAYLQQATASIRLLDEDLAADLQGVTTALLERSDRAEIEQLLSTYEQALRTRFGEDALGF